MGNQYWETETQEEYDDRMAKNQESSSPYDYSSSSDDSSSSSGSSSYSVSNTSRPSSTMALFSNCFVATAVYGDINAPQVQVLREFRDNVLMGSGLGKRAVDLYYSGVGEKAANFISARIPSVIPLIRGGLDMLVNYYQAHR